MSTEAKSPITLPEGKRYKDLDQAHEEGPEAEEALYSTHQAQADNARVYREEIKAIDPKQKDVSKARKLLKALQSRMKPDKKHDGQVEFDVRTGGDEDTRSTVEKVMQKKKGEVDERIEKQKKKVAFYIQVIRNANDVSVVKDWISDAERDVDNGVITGEQLLEVRQAAQERITQLQAEMLEWYKKMFKDCDTPTRVHRWVGFAEISVNRGSLTEEQLLEVRQAAQERIAEIQLEISEKYKQSIKDFMRASIIRTLIRYARESTREGNITEKQFLEILNMAENKILELEEGV